MSDDIPFDKVFDLLPDRATEVAPGVRAIVANNPSPFTFKGTVSYIVGRGKVAIIDPGPDRRRPHRGAARRGARRDRDPHLRHPYPSRSFAGGAARSRRRPARRSTPKGRTGRRGRSMSARPAGSMPPAIRDFRPDWRSPTARSSRATAGRIEARDDAGPHRQPHGVRAQGSRPAVFRRSRHGLVDLDRGAARRRHERLHGLAGKARAAARDDLSARPWRRRCAMRRASCSTTSATARRARPRSCVGSRKGAADIPTLVRAIYIGLDPRLTGAAGLSVLAHLEDLVARGVVATDGPPSIAGPTAWPTPPWRPAEAGLAPAFCCLRLFLGGSRQDVVDLVDQCAHARRWCRDRGGRSATPSARRCGRRRGSARMRTTTSSRKPRIGERAIASMQAVARRGPAAAAHRPRAICAW